MKGSFGDGFVMCAESTTTILLRDASKQTQPSLVSLIAQIKLLLFVHMGIVPSHRPGGLKAVPQFPQGVLRLDAGGIQQC